MELSIPFFDFTAFLRAADTFYVRGMKCSQMQSQYEIRAVWLCLVTFVIVRLFDSFENDLPILRAVGQCTAEQRA